MIYEDENKAERGSIPQIILSVLNEKSQYGYEICKEIERKTSGKVVLKQPSLYSSLRRLEEQNFISSEWQTAENGAKRHYYFLTEKGKEHFEQNEKEWQLDLLVEKLPQNQLKEDRMEKNNVEKNSNKEINSENFSVASQESLFNLQSKKEEIKRIDENQKESDNEFFFQYDLFGQNMKSVKNSAVHIQKVEAYSNKYEKYDNNQADIEPQKERETDSKHLSKISLDTLKRTIKKDGSFIKQMPIKREISVENISEKISESNFNITELIEENEISSKQLNESETQITLENKENSLLTGPQDETSKKDKIEQEKNKIERAPSPLENVIFETNDYRSVIGELFKNSKKVDPYEQNKFLSFKEIFPQTKVQNAPKKDKPQSEIDQFVQSSSEGDIDDGDIETLSNLFHLQGIKIRTHNSVQNTKKSKIYTDKNKLHMVASWLTSLLMIFEIVFTYIFLKNAGNLIRSQLLLFFLSGALAISIFIVPTLENLFDRYKLVVMKIDFKKGITLRLLAFIIICVVTFGICLSLGMQGLTQIEFMAFWLLPVVLSSNIIISYLFYSFLLKQKYFNS